MSEFMQRGTFVGVSRRQDRKDETKWYCSACFNVAKKQDANSIGDDAVYYDADPKLFDTLKLTPKGTPVVLYVEEFEWTKDGITQNRKALVGIEKQVPAKAA